MSKTNIYRSDDNAVDRRALLGGASALIAIGIAAPAAQAAKSLVRPASHILVSHPAMRSFMGVCAVL